LVQPHDLALSYRSEQPNRFRGSFWTTDNQLLADRDIPWSDLIVQAMDLRVRVVLAPHETDEDELLHEEYLKRAQSVLQAWPETAAVVIVANSDPVQAILVEPYALHDAYKLPSGDRWGARPTAGPITVDQLVGDYFASILPTWAPIPRLQVDADEQFQQVVAQVLRSRADQLAQETNRIRIPVKRQGMQSIDEDTLEEIRTFVEQVIAGSNNRESLANLRAWLGLIHD
jgi:hypothetical protein